MIRGVAAFFGTSESGFRSPEDIMAGTRTTAVTRVIPITGVTIRAGTRMDIAIIHTVITTPTTAPVTRTPTTDIPIRATIQS